MTVPDLPLPTTPTELDPKIKHEWRMTWPAHDGKRVQHSPIRRYPVTGSGIVEHRVVTETAWSAYENGAK